MSAELFTEVSAPGAPSAFARPKSSTLTSAVRSELDVGRFQVAMDDALLVRGLECVGHLLRDGDRLVKRHRPARQALREVLSLDELHHQRERRLDDAVDLRDVRVVQRCQCLGFARESRDALGIRCQQLGEDLDRHHPVERGVEGPIHLPHPAGANRRGNLIGPDTGTRGQCHGRREVYLFAPGSRFPVPGSRFRSGSRTTDNGPTGNDQ